MGEVNVLIVGKSDVTCVVVAKIVERSGFKAVCVKPERAGEVLGAARVDAVVLDGGVDNRECDGLMAHIAALRRDGNGTRPAVVLLSNRNAEPHGLLGDIVDVVLAKPITPERFQPFMNRLTERA